MVELATGGRTVNSKTPLYLTLAAAALLGLVLLGFQPYSADWPGDGYTDPARHFIRAALRRDSVALVRLSTSATPVRWALDASRSHPDTLALWKRRVSAFVGERWGDTAEVFLYPPGEGCSGQPIIFRFVGSGNDVRVAEASSACFER